MSGTWQAVFLTLGMAGRWCPGWVGLVSVVSRLLEDDILFHLSSFLVNLRLISGSTLALVVCSEHVGRIFCSI